MKKCSKCGKQLPLTEFKRDSTKKDGLNSSCKSCNVERNKVYRQKPEVKERILKSGKKWRDSGNWTIWYLFHKDEQNSNRRSRNLELKKEVFSHYGITCQCCGEDHIAFLSIDHIDGGGNKHRKELGILGGGINFYKWLKQNNYPKGFQVLCHNCNQAKGYFGMCPHQFKESLE